MALDLLFFCKCIEKKVMVGDFTYVSCCSRYDSLCVEQSTWCQLWSNTKFSYISELRQKSMRLHKFSGPSSEPGGGESTT
jgi:hypothetical protein